MISGALELFKHKLNSSQLNAVSHDQGPAVVFAGAGSGKTRVISMRILRLLLDGRWPSSIMAVSFTNKAAHEMKSRIIQLSDEYKIRSSTHPVFVCTFHSACSRILRTNSEKIGYTNNFSIINENDSKTILKTVLENLGMEKSHPLNIKIIKNYIDKLKNLGISCEFNLFKIDPEETLRRYGEYHDPKLILKCFDEYQKMLKKNNSMDFNDLLIQTVKLLKEHPLVLEQFKRRFKYFLIDEFQDTNSVQFELISTLSFPEHNIFVVGDDDQNIYSWRGADSSYIINFQKKFKEAKIYKLEENYRSSGHIIQAASTLISHNVNRASKAIWTNRELGEKIDLLTFSDSFQEGNQISQTIKTLLQKQSLTDFAILYRTNAQSRILEDCLRKSLIPYIVIGSLRFYERFEIKVLLNYLSLILNPNDDLNFEKTLQIPKKGIGDKSILKLKLIAQNDKISLFQTCIKIINRQIREHNLSNKCLNALNTHINLIEQSLFKIKDSHSSGLGGLLSFIVSRLNFENYLLEHYPDDADDRILNTVELRNALDNFNDTEFEDHNIENKDQPLKKLAVFLEQIQLTIEPTQKNKNSANAVSLLTVHAAKGLEFNHVFLCGLEEGTLPHYNANDNPIGIEEERRLLYVGITRAKNSLTISKVKTNRFRPLIPAVPSRFLDEITTESLNIHELTVNKNNNHYSRITHQNETRDSKEVNFETHFSIGSKVKHKIFGEGIVHKVEQSKCGFNVDVYFNNYGLKKLLDSFLENEVSHQ